MRNKKNYFNLPYNPELKQRAKDLRKAGILHEVLLWQVLRNGGLNGLDFDRQKIIGDYIVDFYCPERQIVIEIDGSSHDDKDEYDMRRDDFLGKIGLEVIHIKAVDVLQNLNSVIDFLLYHPALALLPPRPVDTPPREGN